jgi:hypothetical protein
MLMINTVRASTPIFAATQDCMSISTYVPLKLKVKHKVITTMCWIKNSKRGV